MIKIFTDGGARGNPGPAALGVYICNQKDEEIFSVGKYIGETTNNVAEYSAVLEAFLWLREKNIQEEVRFFLDSELVCRQLNGIYKVKNAVLLGFLQKIKVIEAALGLKVTFSHIPRELNKKADRMVNIALDSRFT
jgi:ribonuclease HI